MRPILPLCLALAASFPPAALPAPGPLQLAQRDRDERRDEPRARGEERREQPRRAEERREGPHGFFRGERVPDEYRHRNYVVDNWRLHRLHAPPRGYQWISVGADYLLVAIATGVIAEVLSGGQVASAPPAPAPAAPGAPLWFCASANAYYPYVTQCPEGWRPVTPPPRY